MSFSIKCNSQILNYCSRITASELINFVYAELQNIEAFKGSIRKIIEKNRITDGVGKIWEVSVFLFSPDSIYAHHLEESW